LVIGFIVVVRAMMNKVVALCFLPFLSAELSTCLSKELNSYIAKEESPSSNPLLGIGGGKWSSCTHLTTWGINFDVGLGRLLTRVIKPQSALEFGCGIGIYVNYLSNHGVDRVIGIEPESMRSVGLMPGDGCKTKVGTQLALDVSTATSDVLDSFGQYDVVYSIEVLEHIPRQYHDKVADFLANRVGKWLVFAASYINQTKYGHIAARPVQEWITEWTKRGLVYMPLTTEACSTWLFDTKNIWHRKDIMIFTNPKAGIIDTNLKEIPGLEAGKEKEAGERLWPEIQKEVQKCKNQKQN
jgi:hypothetical protein